MIPEIGKIRLDRLSVFQLEWYYARVGEKLPRRRSRTSPMLASRAGLDTADSSLEDVATKVADVARLD